MQIFKICLFKKKKKSSPTEEIQYALRVSTRFVTHRHIPLLQELPSSSWTHKTCWYDQHVALLLGVNIPGSRKDEQTLGSRLLLSPLKRNQESEHDHFENSSQKTFISLKTKPHVLLWSTSNLKESRNTVLLQEQFMHTEQDWKNRV